MDESREAVARRLTHYFKQQKLNQSEFGKRYALGNQSNVGHYLHARRPLSLDAANRFVSGLKEQGVAVELSDISVALAAQRDKLALGLPSGPEPIKGKPKTGAAGERQTTDSAVMPGHKGDPKWTTQQWGGHRKLTAAQRGVWKNVLLFLDHIPDKSCDSLASLIAHLGSQDQDDAPSADELMKTSVAAVNDAARQAGTSLSVAKTALLADVVFSEISLNHSRGVDVRQTAAEVAGRKLREFKGLKF